MDASEAAASQSSLAFAQRAAQTFSAFASDGALTYMSSNGSSASASSLPFSYQDDDNTNNNRDQISTISRLMLVPDSSSPSPPSLLFQPDDLNQSMTSEQQQQQAQFEFDQNSIVNVTRDFPLDYAIVMFGYLLPLVLVVTIVTNLLVVAVLYQRHMRTPTNIVLFTMAIVDLCTLLSPSPWYLYIYTFGNHNKFLYPPTLCYAHHMMTDVIPVFFHTSSVWLALLLASQRYIYVCHPTLARTWCTVPRVNRAIYWILAIAFAHQIPRFFDQVFESTRIEFNNLQYYACSNSVSSWVEYVGNIYFVTYYTFRIFFVFIIPCFALLALNLLLFRALKRAENKRCQLLKTKFKTITDAEPTCERHLLAGGSAAYLAASGGNGNSSYNALANSGLTNTLAGNTIIEDQTTAGAGSSGQSSPQSDDTTGQVSPLDPVDLRKRQQLESSETKEGQHQEVSISNQEVIQGHASERRKLARSANGVSRSLKSSASGSGSASSGSRTSRSSGTSSKIDMDHESSCPECAAYRRADAEAAEAGDGCRRCYAALGGESSPPGGASSFEHRSVCRSGRHVLQHQPTSQSSSILGGVTNTITTTNDGDEDGDLSRSSMFGARADGTLDMLETATGGPDEEEELSINCCDDGEEAAGLNDDSEAALGELRVDPSGGGGGSLKRGVFGKRTVARATASAAKKSGSVESRLTCDCHLTQPAGQAVKSRTCGQLSSSTGRVPLAEKEGGAAAKKVGACLSYSIITNGEKEKQQPVVGCKCTTANCSRTSGESSTCGGLKCGEQQTRASTRGLVSASQGEGKEEAQQKSKCTTTKSQEGQTRQQRAASQCPAPPMTLVTPHISTSTGQPSAAGTTSTTLYSAHTNSVGSLDGQQQQGVGRDEASNSLGATAKAKLSQQQQQRMKSPSYASCATTTGGRGSRGTLFGSTAVPLIVSGQQQQQQQQQNNITATISSSSRTMDSNRTTLMLVVVVTVYLIVEVPVALVTVTHVVLNLFNVFPDAKLNWVAYIKLFTNFFIMISYSVNFTIYCSMSKKFRETFRDLFFCGRSAKRKRAKRMLYQSQAQSTYEPYTHVTHQFVPPASSMLLTNIGNNSNTNNITTSNFRDNGSCLVADKSHGADASAVAANNNNFISDATSMRTSTTTGRSNGKSCEFLTAPKSPNHHHHHHAQVRRPTQNNNSHRTAAPKCEV